jgi:hypothetical protein
LDNSIKHIENLSKHERGWETTLSKICAMKIKWNNWTIWGFDPRRKRFSQNTTFDLTKY